jgi:hypothetical protein
MRKKYAVQAVGSADGVYFFKPSSRKKAEAWVREYNAEPIYTRLRRRPVEIVEVLEVKGEDASGLL